MSINNLASTFRAVFLCNGDCPSGQFYFYKDGEFVAWVGGKYTVQILKGMLRQHTTSRHVVEGWGVFEQNYSIPEEVMNSLPVFY